MKKSVFFLLGMVLLLASCESSSNYSVKIETQKQKIRDYIAANGIEILKEYPADSVFAPNQYLWEHEDSILFRLDRRGVGEPIEIGDHVNVRWVQYSLETGDSTSYWTTIDMPYPLELVYNPELTKYNIDALGNRSNSDCVGWQSALRLMGRSDAVADIIIPSPIGLRDAFVSITAYRYKFTFKNVVK